MTPKYASPLAEAQAKLAAARNAARAAKITFNQLTADRRTADSAHQQWAEQWPELDKLEGRPTYQGPDGLAVSVDGSPFMIGDFQANNCDIYKPPPPTDETRADLGARVTKAEKQEKTAFKAELKARAEWEPPADTGWIVLKPRLIGGVRYAIGDAIDPKTVEPRRWEQFKSAGLVGHG